MVDFMFQFILIVVSSLSGFMIGKALYSDKKSTDGVVFINTSDPECALCGVTFNKGANDLLKKDVVTLQVKTHE